MGNNQFHFTGAVTINVQAPAPAVPPPPPPRPAELVAPEKQIRFDPDKTYKNRKGYSPTFLGSSAALKVPLPTVTAARSGELFMKNGKPYLLKYHHFSLVMNATRRLQMWSAANVDYDSTKKSQRNRDEFGKDTWIRDDRLPPEAQIQGKEFYDPATNIDRGHVVRREDNAWGDSETAIEYANSDTFHWTNCTPQHEAYNQATPGRNDPTYRGMSGLWGAFENHIQSSRKGQDTKATVLAGPVLNNEKDPARDFGLGRVQYPESFWKVVVVADADSDDEDAARTLKVYGFVLSQKDVLGKFGIEVFDPDKFKKYMTSLKDITKLTGVEFDAGLHGADMFGKL